MMGTKKGTLLTAGRRGRRRLRVTSLVLLAGLLAGCVHEPQKDSAKPDSGEVEYEYVTTLGSNIPVKVPKGSRPAGTTTSPTSTLSTEESPRALLRELRPAADRSTLAGLMGLELGGWRRRNVINL
jgi:hypothetical protein